MGLVFKGKEHIIKTGFVLKAAVLTVALIIVFAVNLWLVPGLMKVDNLIDYAKESTTKGEVKDALKSLHEACELNPKDIRPDLELVYCYRDFYNPKESGFEFWYKSIYINLEKAIRLSPFSASLYYMKGQLQQDNAVMLEDLIKNESDIKTKVSLMRERDEILKESAECFRRAVELYPTKPEYMYRLGKALEAIDKIPAALEAYRQALNLNEGVTLKRLKLSPEELKDILHH